MINLLLLHQTNYEPCPTPSPRGILSYWEGEGGGESQEESDGRKRLGNQPRSRYYCETKVPGERGRAHPSSSWFLIRDQSTATTMTKKKRRGGRGSLCHSLRLSLPPKKFRLRRLWQRLARERQSGDNAGRKTAGRERGPTGHPRDIAQSGARRVLVVRARLYKCKGGQANTWNRFQANNRILGSGAVTRLRFASTYIYMYIASIRVYTHVCIHNANTHARIRGGIHASGWRRRRRLEEEEKSDLVDGRGGGRQKTVEEEEEVGGGGGA